MKKLGRKHRPFFRICAVDSRKPRDGAVLEELGTYDPLVPEVDARVLLNKERVAYWLGVGAQPSENCTVFIKKYGVSGTHLAEQEAARARLSLPQAPSTIEQPVYVAPPKASPVVAEAEATAEPAPADESAPETEATSEPAAEAAE
jgi:small subunit ribosomal protein S16